MNVCIPAPRYRFGRFDRVTISGVAYAYDSPSPTGHFFRAEHDLNAALQNFPHELLYEKVQAGELSIEKDARTDGKVFARARYGNRLVTDLPEKNQKKVLWRQSLVDNFLRLEAEGKVSRSDSSIAKYYSERTAELADIDNLAKGRKARAGTPKNGGLEGPCPRTFRRWLKRYSQSNFDVMSLNDCYRFPGTRPSKFTAEERTLHRKWACQYASLNKPSKAMLYEQLKAEVETLNEERKVLSKPALRVPSRRTFESMIDGLDSLFVLTGREGAAYAHRKLQITHTGNAIERPLQVVEMDEWKVELSTILMDIGIWETLSAKEKAKVERSRVWLSIAIDVATRCILAMRFLNAAPSAESSIVTLEMAVNDKSHVADIVGTYTPWEMHGTPENVRTDAGAAYVAHSFKATVLALSGTSAIPPAGQPQLRGTVERIFRTIRDRFLAWFSGQTFANVVVRGDYDHQANASLSVEELNRLLVRAIVDCYHNTPHEGLAGETPRNAWLRLTHRHPVTPPPVPYVRRSIFGVHCERRIGDKGIRFLGIHYQSPRLQEIRTTRVNASVKIRVNRFDLGEISFWDDVIGGWGVAQARYADFRGVNVWEWIATVDHLNRVHADNARIGRAAVVKALIECRAYGEMAVARAELGSPVLSDNYFRQVEKTHFKTFGMVEDGSVLDAIDDHPLRNAELISQATDDLNPDDDGFSAAPGRFPQPQSVVPAEDDVDCEQNETEPDDQSGGWSFDD